MPKEPQGQKRLPIQIVVSEVWDLGGGRYSVRLNARTGSPETALSQTQTVSADGIAAAVQATTESFLRWLNKATDYAIRNMPSRMRN